MFIEHGGSKNQDHVQNEADVYYVINYLYPVYLGIEGDVDGEPEHIPAGHDHDQEVPVVLELAVVADLEAHVLQAIVPESLHQGECLRLFDLGVVWTQRHFIRRFRIKCLLLIG